MTLFTQRRHDCRTVCARAAKSRCNGGPAVTDCIFCALQHAQATLLDANELAYAVLDIAPIRPGHTLIIPRQHVEDFFELSAEVQMAMLELANRLAKALKVVCNPLRMGMLVSGFDVAHAHLHLVPIHDVHDISSKVLLEGGKLRMPDDQLQQLRGQLHLQLQGPPDELARN